MNLPPAMKRAAWWAATLRPRRVRAGIAKGLLMDLRRASGWYAKGTNEMPIQNALAEYLKPGDTFFDIGANVGFFSLIAARLVAPSGRVFSFEPVPANAAAIRRNAALNHFSHIKVTEAAVGDSAGEIELILTRHPGGASIMPDTPSPDVTGRIRVPMVQIDALVHAGTVSVPSFVKIDVEGAEHAVLRGMEQTARAHHPIIVCELDDASIEAVQGKVAGVQELLHTWGYEVRQLDRAYATDGWPVRHLLAIRQ
jgi:FkbM family methyltransferase